MQVNDLRHISVDTHIRIHALSCIADGTHLGEVSKQPWQGIPHDSATSVYIQTYRQARVGSASTFPAQSDWLVDPRSFWITFGNSQGLAFSPDVVSLSRGITMHASLQHVARLAPKRTTFTNLQKILRLLEKLKPPCMTQNETSNKEENISSG